MIYCIPDKCPFCKGELEFTDFRESSIKDPSSFLGCKSCIVKNYYGGHYCFSIEFYKGALESITLMPPELQLFFNIQYRPVPITIFGTVPKDGTNLKRTYDVIMHKLLPINIESREDIERHLKFYGTYL